MTRSGLTCGILARAILPLAAVPTTSRAGSLGQLVGHQPAKHDRVIDDQDANLRHVLLLEDVEQVELGDQDFLGERLHQILVGPGVQGLRHLRSLSVSDVTIRMRTRAIGRLGPDGAR